jgi:hypothetical protein
MFFQFGRTEKGSGIALYKVLALEKSEKGPNCGKFSGDRSSAIVLRLEIGEKAAQEQMIHVLQFPARPGEVSDELLNIASVRPQGVFGKIAFGEQVVKESIPRSSQCYLTLK